MTMKTYLVGGAVRDSLLGLPLSDRDFVVVDGTSQAMLAAGFLPVGRDFPIFLHPQTREEHALVRGGQVGPGSLEADLRARDLTINAMAMDPLTQELVDPLNGALDLRARLLRAAPGFTDDPLRILRAARFAARFHALGFRPEPGLMALMKTQVAAGKLDQASPDRVWLEISKALRGPHPEVFVQTLNACGALAAILPEVAALYGVPQAAQWHPEIDTGIHTEMVLAMAARLAPGELDIAWAALTHDLGKALTPPDQWPKHHSHEQTGLVPLAAVHERLPVPSACIRLAQWVCVNHLEAHTAFQSRPGTLHKLFTELDAYRRPDTLNRFLVACEADKRGRGGMSEDAYPQRAYLLGAFAAARAVKAQPLIAKGWAGEKLATELGNARIQALLAFKKTQPAPPAQTHAATPRAGRVRP